MAMESCSTISKESISETFSNLRQIYHRTLTQKSGRESFQNKVAVKALLSPEKRVDRKKSYIRSLRNKPVHKVSHFQDVDPERGKSSSSQELLDYINRFKRWL